MREPRFLRRRQQSTARRDRFLPFRTQFRNAFPHIEVVVEDVLAEGDKVAARCSVRGKHEGDGLGFKATESMVDFDGIGIGPSKTGCLSKPGPALTARGNTASWRELIRRTLSRLGIYY